MGSARFVEDCPRRIFAEQITGLADRYQRRTRMLRTLLTEVALALGGRAGGWMASRLAAEVSRMTLLRLIRALPVPESEGLVEAGVDEVLPG